MPPSRHSISNTRGRRASWASRELAGSRRPASLHPDRPATKSRQSASVGRSCPRACRNLANAFSSASWRLIVVRDLPAALNAAITRADASRTLAVSMRIGLSDRGEQTRRFFAGLCGRNEPAWLCYQRRCCFRPHNPAIHIMAEGVRADGLGGERRQGGGRHCYVAFEDRPDAEAGDALAVGVEEQRRAWLGVSRRRPSMFSCTISVARAPVL